MEFKLRSSATIQTPKEMEDKISEYFQDVTGYRPILDKEGQPLLGEDGRPLHRWIQPTVSGMAFYMGFTSRQSLTDYKGKQDKNGNFPFADIIKKGILYIESIVEQQLITGKANAGAIFWMKNHGWKDNQSVEISGNLRFEDALSSMLSKLPDPGKTE